MFLKTTFTVKFTGYYLDNVKQICDYHGTIFYRKGNYSALVQIKLTFKDIDVVKVQKAEGHLISFRLKNNKSRMHSDVQTNKT